MNENGESDLTKSLILKLNKEKIQEEEITKITIEGNTFSLFVYEKNIIVKLNVVKNNLNAYYFYRANKEEITQALPFLDSASDLKDIIESIKELNEQGGITASIENEKYIMSLESDEQKGEIALKKYSENEIEQLEVEDEGNKPQDKPTYTLSKFIIILTLIFLFFLGISALGFYIAHKIKKTKTEPIKTEPKKTEEKTKIPVTKPIIDNKTQEIEITISAEKDDEYYSLRGNLYKDAEGKRQVSYHYLNQAKMFLNDKEINNTLSIQLKKGTHKIKYVFDYSLETCYGMFANCKNITSIKFTNFKTKNINSTQSMFANCHKLKSIEGLNKFDTANVKSMKNMFYGCESLASLDLSSFNTKNVKDMEAMFYKCASLAALDLSKFVTTNVNNMLSMFAGCKSLSSINLSNFDTTNVREMEFMFDGCKNLKSLDLASFNTKNVESMNYIFDSCDSLKEVKLSKNCLKFEEILNKNVKITKC